MSLFGLRKASTRYGAVIDIGSGSVIASIIHSDPNKKYPTIVWSHREHAPLRNVDSLERSAKAVMTALVNTSIMLDSEGRKALFDYDSSAELSELQCSISAPWSYTVSKTINYSQEKEFKVTDELIEELENAIEVKISTELKENETLQDLGLQVVANITMNLSANGYLVKKPEGNEVKTLSISQASAVTQQYLIDAIDELQQKLFPKTEAEKLSFILMLYGMTQELLGQTNDFSLIDITYEATEIAIVRGGVLSYCTHTPFGSFSLAREISEITGVPLHEAFGYMHTDKPYSFMESLPKQQLVEVEKLFEAYTERISNLFKETGDNLSIPKKISIHADLKSELFFRDIINKAAIRTLKIPPTITLISSDILKEFYAELSQDSKTKPPTDTALLLSAQFFHNKTKTSNYEYF